MVPGLVKYNLGRSRWASQAITVVQSAADIDAETGIRTD